PALRTESLASIFGGLASNRKRSPRSPPAGGQRFRSSPVSPPPLTRRRFVPVAERQSDLSIEGVRPLIACNEVTYSCAHPLTLRFRPEVELVGEAIARNRASRKGCPSFRSCDQCQTDGEKQECELLFHEFSLLSSPNIG